MTKTQIATLSEHGRQSSSKQYKNPSTNEFYFQQVPAKQPTTMSYVYNWLEDANHVSYAPTSPALAPFDPMDGMSYAEDPIDPTTSGGNGNIDPALTLPVNPPLTATRNAPAPAISVLSATSILEEITKSNNAVLVCLTRLIERPNDLNAESTAEPEYTAEELEALEPIPEQDSEPPLADVIDGVLVNPNPQPDDIKEVLDVRRVGQDRKTFYLAKDLDGSYYWFHPPRTDRDEHLSQLIKNYRRDTREEVLGRETYGVKKLRNGKKIRI
jgi:hypothetical protein